MRIELGTGFEANLTLTQSPNDSFYHQNVRPFSQIMFKKPTGAAQLIHFISIQVREGLNRKLAAWSTMTHVQVTITEVNVLSVSALSGLLALL